jgi:hypothetical protein
MDGDNAGHHGCILIGVLTSACLGIIASGRECGVPPSRQITTPAMRLPDLAHLTMIRKVGSGSNASADRTSVPATTCSPLDPLVAPERAASGYWNFPLPQGSWLTHQRGCGLHLPESRGSNVVQHRVGYAASRDVRFLGPPANPIVATAGVPVRWQERQQNQNLEAFPKFPFGVMPGEGFEPPTFGLQNRCTTTVLTRRRRSFTTGWLA